MSVAVCASQMYISQRWALDVVSFSRSNSWLSQHLRHRNIFTGSWTSPTAVNQSKLLWLHYWHKRNSTRSSMWSASIDQYQTIHEGRDWPTEAATSIIQCWSTYVSDALTVNHWYWSNNAARERLLYSRFPIFYLPPDILHAHYVGHEKQSPNAWCSFCRHFYIPIVKLIKFGRHSNYSHKVFFKRRGE